MPRKTLAWRVTLTVVPTTSTGLTVVGFETRDTRYCVFAGTDRIGNENAPVAPVTCGLPSWTQVVNGHALASSLICRLA